MSHPDTPAPTLEDLILAVQASGLTAARKREQASAIRTVAKALGTAPGHIPAHVKLLRQRLGEVSPESMGISSRRWANVRVLLNRSLELQVKVMPSAQRAEILPAWRKLTENLPRSARLRLTSLIRFLSSRGIEPGSVQLADLEAFGKEICENRLRANPEKTWDGIIWAWNKLVTTTTGWPQVVIPRADKRVVYVRPWEDFPQSLRDEAADYLKLLSGKTIDEEGPLRVLKPSTLASRNYQLRAAASALAASGVPSENIKSLSDIARLAPMKRILEHVLHRGSGEHKAEAFNFANVLRAVAKYWVKVDEPELKKISQICSRLSQKNKGMTEKNRRRLMPFNDPETVKKFLDLPEQLASEVRASKTKNVVNAVSAQMAVALAILQAVPIRVGNLAALDLEKHVVASAGKVYILIDEHEVKNDQPYQMELSKGAADLLSWYCLEHRELLLDQPSTALFPGENGRPKLASTLGRQITERIRQYLGLAINPHLFRHIAAKLYLDRRPGEYALVSRLLNHKSVTTTMRAYTGTETISAGRHFQMLVNGLRSQKKPSSTKRRKVRL